MDGSRIHDLEIMNKELKAAPSNTAEKHNIEKAMYRVINSSPMEDRLREKLILAVRHNDHRGIKYLTEKLHKLRWEELNGQRF